MDNHLAELEQQAIFWGKFLREERTWLPLPAHCLDVALVFRALCELDGFRRVLNTSANTTLSEQQLDRLSVLAMLHDVGKANLGFQRKVFQSDALRAGHIRELAPLLDPEIADPYLQQAFVRALPPEMAEWFQDEYAEYSYFLASFSHHGLPLQFKGERRGNFELARAVWWRRQDPWDPMTAVAQVAQWARRTFPGAFRPGGDPLPSAPRFHHRFAGLLMLADWLGSHRDWFPIHPVTYEERLAWDRKIIPQLLAAVGLDARAVREGALRGLASFRDRFGFDPRPLQAAVDALDPDDDRTRLVIAESETGSGKTEAALNWFFKLFAAGKVDGLYFALPTRVAAREIYKRVLRTVERWFPDPLRRPVTVLAVPGYPQVDGISPRHILPPEEESRWQDDAALRRRERQWAAEHPKRFLAATVAVGTIDQALLSAVQTAHAHLRSVCLDRSLLVVDEVHASDVYMSRLLDGLLAHHLAVGGWAMLLSATLGARARQRFAVQGGGERPDASLAAARQTPYPALTLADGVPRAVPAVGVRSKEIALEVLPLAFQWDGVVDRLKAALDAGARVLVVMNTVGRANALLRALEAEGDVPRHWLFRCGDVVCPHHGRFAPADRTFMDEQVSRLMGPQGPPGPLVLIGTQTLEQSLDIDADFMITDLAPADVLLQRLGRLHRHLRRRPAGYERPRCLVLAPGESLEEGLDPQGDVVSAYRALGCGSVYEDVRALELTRRALLEKPLIKIPEDNRWLVEAATHPDQLASLGGERWARHGQKVDGENLARSVAAAFASAVYTEYFGKFEFNEAGGRVVVRLGANSLQLPLQRPVESPFSQLLREIVIPGHMAPHEADDTVAIEEVEEGIITLRCGDRRYQYSRYGLEAIL